MKDKIVIVGGGGQGKVIINVIKKLDKYDILGYTDLIDKGSVLGARFLGTDEVLPNILKDNKDCKAVIGIGSVQVSVKRQQIYKLLKDIGFELPVIISKDALIAEDVSIAEGTVVLERALLNVGSRVGKCVLVNSGAIIEHDCLVGNFVHLAVGAIICGGVKIDDNSIIGAGAKVLQYKKIAGNCLIAAGSVVIKDIVREGIYFGIPASKSEFNNSFKPLIR